MATVADKDPHHSFFTFIFLFMGAIWTMVIVFSLIHWVNSFMNNP